MKRLFATAMFALIITAASPSKAANFSNLADQYMALCTESREHGGQEYALTSWLDSRDAANEAGKRHERATRGHRWTIRTRQRPESEYLWTTGVKPFSVAIGLAETTLPMASAFLTPTPVAGCGGTACGVVSVAWNGQGYDIRNGSDRRVLVKIRFLFGWSCMGPSDIPLGPGETKKYGNGGYCNPIEANYQ